MNLCLMRAVGTLAAAFAAVPSVAAPPVGLDAISDFDHLMELRDGVRTCQVSSHDPAGGNNDQGNYLYALTGEQVLLDVLGPGCVYRIWMTGQDSNGYIRIYLDQSTTPQIQMTLGEFFGGGASSFIAPLVADDSLSSGGFTCYVPIPFRTGCRITTTSLSYYSITYQMFADDTGVTTFTGQEDTCAAQVAWQYPGYDPKTDTGAQTLSQDFTIDPGQTITPATLTGPGIIQGLELHFPGMQIADRSAVQDEGRSFLGHVNFAVAVNPANQGVRLVRRIDYSVADQMGSVYINGAPAGDWYTPGSMEGMFFDTAFDVPPELTASQSVLNVQIDFVNSSSDWNEFYYRVYSNVAGQYVQTDYLNVGNLYSESLHQYAITTPSWFGTRTLPANVVPDGTFREILQKTRLVIKWDSDFAPSVDAPLALFFGGGTGQAYVQSLPVGMDTDRLYCYLPMPFATSARVQIVNESAQTISPLHIDLHYTPMTDLPADYANFHAAYRSESPTTAGADYTILDETGTGHLVGVVQMMHSSDGSRTYLEGDERIYVDASLTPALYGTGTADFFNGGGYFSHGTFTLPAAGNPVHEITSGDTTVAYRFFLGDLIPFNSSIHVGIEHGPLNDMPDDVSSVAFYYKQTAKSLVTSDELDVGDASSESAHMYTTQSAGWSGTLSETYEGDYDDITITDNGRHLTAPNGRSSFTVRTSTGARSVMLRRRLDYSVPNQAARVYVNDVLAGIWYDAGSNTTHPWRDSDFMIPPALTQDVQQLAIRIENASPASDWTEYHYWVYSLHRSLTPPADFDRDGDVDLEDFGHFQICLSRFGEPRPAECNSADFNGDNWIDQSDFSVFKSCFSGPNHPPGPGC